MKKFAGIILCFLITSCIAAQTQQYKFKQLNINHGLSHNQVNTIFKDRSGFIWIGTIVGLNRYDGYTLRTFRSDSRDSSSLSDNNILKIFEAPDGTLCINTGSGLNLYNPRTEKFSRKVSSFYKRYDLADGSLSDIRKDPDGNFWFIQNTSIRFYNPKHAHTIAIENIPGDTTSIINAPITSFAFGDSGNNWVIHANGVFEKISIDASVGKVTFRNHFLSKINNERLFSYNIHADRDGDLWFITINDNQGVYHYDNHSKHFNRYTVTSPPIQLNTNLTSGLVEDSDGLIWLGTDHGGINVIDKRKKAVNYIYHREEDETTLAQNSINALYRDNLGMIWVGTYKRGVSYYHKSIFRFAVYKQSSIDPTGLPYADVNRFAEDEHGNLWIGTNGGGLIYFNRSKGTFKQYLHNPGDPTSLGSNVIVSLCIDYQNKLWIGTYYGGLNSFDGTKFKRYVNIPTDTTSISGRSVWEIFEDSKRNLWIGTLEGGVNIYNRNTDDFRRLPVSDSNAIQSTYISAIMEDSHGDIWFGSATGMDVLSPASEKFRHYEYNSDDEGSVSNNSILDILEDSKGRVWVATHEGLNLYDRNTDRFSVFKEKDGLPHNSILTIQEDSLGHLWLGTPKGLSEMIYSEGTAKFGNFTQPDGLQGLQFNENASFKTRRGELIFGGPNGFNIFKPEELDVESNAYKVAFTDFQLFQKSVGIGEKISGRVILDRAITEVEKITLPPDQNFFSIEFSALNYFHPEKSRYLYKLEGLNTDWLPVDANTRKITFTNLGPHEYVLKVKASVNGIGWSEPEATLAITILPPFWKTKVAFVLYLLFVAGVLFLARKLVQQREQMKFSIEQERTEAIRMHELDMMKIKFFTNVSHEFRTPLTLILTPLEKMLRHPEELEQRKQHLLIHRNAKRLLTLVNQLLDFRKLEVQDIKFSPSEGDIIGFIRETVFSFSDLSEKKDIKLLFSSNIDVLETIFDQDKLEKILFNLLSNAFKFTPEHGTVAVEVLLQKEERSLLTIVVRDTGIGIPSDKLDKVFERFFQNDLPRTMVNQGSGIGLSITREFVRIHQGEIKVESEVGKGSVFTVVIPVPEIFKDQKQAKIQSSDPEYHQVVSTAPANNPLPEPVSDKAHSLLLIEDNDDFRFYLKDNLKQFYRIYEARNGEEGWKQTLGQQPDLIVSDVMMPLMNGIELCRKIKTDERVSHIPVILLTARSSEEQRLEGFETGADDYISKPFNFEILESRIRNLIMLRERSHKTFRQTLEVKASELNITPLDTKFIANAIQCVEQNVSSADFSVEDLGRELGISRAYLYKKLMALTGKSPLEFIRTIRLQHAAQLLEKSQLTVAEVAYQVGFNNPKYFTKYFKEEFNILPSGYAASRRKSGDLDK